MSEKTSKKSFSRKKKVLLVVGVILLAFIIGIVRYLTFSLPADEEAVAAMASKKDVIVEEVGNTIVFTPVNEKTNIGYIYYPGGQVDPKSFAYAAEKIAESGIKVVIQKMPFNLAFFGKDRALDVIDSYPEIDKWYIGGFSLGGVAASMVASDNPDKFEGIILYTSYTTKKYSLANTDLEVLSLSGSNDGLATPEKIEAGKDFLPASATYVEIPGGNHTQMAVYGDGNLQKGDNKAGLSRVEQQKTIIEDTVRFIKSEK